MRAEPGPGPLTRQRPFCLLWFGETVNVFGTSLVVVVFPLVAVVELGASVLEVGLLTASAWLPIVLVGLPAGAWVDRRSRRRVMVACDGGTVATFTAVAVLGATGLLRIEHLIAAALVGGGLVVVFTTAYRAYLPTIVAVGQRAEAAAKLQGAEWIARIAGQGLAGVVTAVGGILSGALVAAGAALVSLCCVLLVPADRAAPGGRPVRELPQAPPTVVRRGLGPEIAVGVRTVLADPYLRSLTAFAAAGALARGVQQAVLVVFVVRDVGLTTGGAGLVLTAAAVGGVVGALLVPRLGARIGTGRAVLLANLLTAPCAVLVPLAGGGPAVVLVVLGTLLTGAGAAATEVVVSAFRMTYCAAEVLGRVTATMMVMTFALLPVGALVGGLLGDVLGARPTLWVAALVLVSSVGLLLAGPLRTARHLPAAPAADAPGPG